MIDRTFRGPEVVRLVGITYRQLDYWARTDMLRPSITEANGSGSVRRYSYWDVLDLLLVAHLLNNGMSVQRCRRVLDAVRETDYPYDKFLIIDGGRTHLVPHTVEAILGLIDDMPAVSLLVSLPSVVSELDERILDGGQLELAGA